MTSTHRLRLSFPSVIIHHLGFEMIAVYIIIIIIVVDDYYSI